MLPLAQAAPNFFSDEAGSSTLFIKILVGFLLGIGLIFLFTQVPPRLKRPITAAFTFVAGLYYVLWWLWPKAIDLQPDEAPTNAIESFSIWLQDANPIVSQFRNILSAFLIGLGIYSLMRIHLGRVAKKQKDWTFSVVLLVSMAVMTVFAFMDWKSRQGTQGALLDDPVNWTFVNYARHFMFEGLFQQMEAAMFSIIAFYILSAAYRAFRVRSIEASILLVTALVVMLSLLGAVAFLSQGAIDGLTGGNKDAFLQNFTLGSIKGWIETNVQGPAIRGLQFGVGIGLLALALRIWLSLEKTGSSS
jgi:hypothetical protein